MKSSVGRLLDKRPILVAIVVLSGIGLLLIGWRLGRQPNPTPRQITAEEVRADVGAEPKKPAVTSSACKLVEGDTMARVVGSKVTEVYATIPDSSTSNTSLAGCGYMFEAGSLRTVQVIIRTGPDIADAFKRTTQDATKLTQSSGEAYQVSTDQVIKLNDKNLITITGIKRDGQQNITQQLTDIANLY